MSGSGTPDADEEPRLLDARERPLPPFERDVDQLGREAPRSSARPTPRWPAGGTSSGARRSARPRRSHRDNGRPRRSAARRPARSARSSVLGELHLRRAHGRSLPSSPLGVNSRVYTCPYTDREQAAAPGRTARRHPPRCRTGRSPRPDSPTPPWRTSRPPAASPSSSSTGTSGPRRSSTARSSSRSSTTSARSSGPSWRCRAAAASVRGRCSRWPGTTPPPSRSCGATRHASRSSPAYAAELRSVSVAGRAPARARSTPATSCSTPGAPRRSSAGSSRRRSPGSSEATPRATRSSSQQTSAGFRALRPLL